MITARVSDHRPLLVVLALLIVVAWAALVMLDRSPYGAYLDHQLLGEREQGAAIDLEYARLAALFVAGWTLMTVAMMLPTALPLVVLFRRVTANRGDATLLMAAVVSGYLGVWVAAGAFAHLGDLGIHAGIERSHWLRDRSWLLPVAVLAAAGAYQFSGLKYLCLDKCRSPYSFVVEHWNGVRPAVEALRLGVHHGLFCLGCCWSLMLLMFAVGAGNLAFMAALAVVMAVEKNLPWGRKISAPLGVVLLGLAAGLLISQLTLGTACAHDGGACVAS